MTAPQATATAAGSAQAAQAGLVLAMGADLTRAWGSLDVNALRSSLPDFTALIAALVRRYGPASATLAARFYKQQRAVAGVRGAFTVIPADPPGLRQVGATVDWATQPLWSTSPDVTGAQAKVTAAVEKLVLDTGRDTITNNVKRDRLALGWVRITEPNPCAFCALLATRGAVYAEQSFKSANKKFKDHPDFPSDFKTHDNCRCHAEPVFGTYEPPAHVAEWMQLYRDSTTGGNAARTRREWRRAFDAHAGQQ